MPYKDNQRRRAAYQYSEADYWRRLRLMERYKNAAFGLLGKACRFCGIQDHRVLQFDHIKGGGSQHRQKVNYYRVLRYIVEHPEEFQVLCANCNQIKRYQQREGIGFGSHKDATGAWIEKPSPQADLWMEKN